MHDWNRRLVERLGRNGTIGLGLLVSLVFLAFGGPLFLAGATSSLAVIVAFAAVLVGPALWVLVDARKRGVAQPLLWGLFALLGNVIGAIVYVLVRNDHKSARPCATCGQPVAANHSACAWCGALASSARRTCRSCHNELELEWRFCPYCRTEVGRTTSAA